MLNAIILAGSTNRGSLQQYSKENKEALIKISGRSMVEYVLAALDQTSRIGKIVLVGLEQSELEYRAHKETIFVEAGATLQESLAHGVEALPTVKQVLLVTADIPLLQVNAIENFLAQCGDMQADIYYPVISRELCQRRYPGVQRTYASLREGTYTGGNIFLLNPQVMSRCQEMFKLATVLRKSPIRLSKLLGGSFLFRFICRRLSLHDIEAKLLELLGVKVKIIVSKDPELGVDVDKPSDLELVKKELAKIAIC